MKKNLITFCTLFILFGTVTLSLYSGQDKAQVPLLKEAKKLGMKGNYREAINTLNREIDTIPYARNKRVYLYLGLMYFKIEDFDNAHKAFMHAIALDAQSPMSYYFLGMIYEAQALKSNNKDQEIVLKKKALQSWKKYLINSKKRKRTLKSHRNIGCSIKASRKQAHKHIETLSEELDDE